MTEIPNPAQVAQQQQAAQEQSLERERVKTVRSRRRLIRGGRLARDLDPETAAALAKLAHPDVDARG